MEEEAPLRMLESRRGKPPALPGSGWTKHGRDYWRLI